jgi:hypothetical protein
VLGREPVVDREHLDARAGRDPPAQPVVRVEIAEHPHPAVQVDEQRARLADRPVVPGRRTRAGPVHDRRQPWPRRTPCAALARRLA